MVEFTVHDESSAPNESKPTLAKAKEQFGLIPNLYGVLAESPQALAAYQELGDQFLQTSLSKPAKLIVWLTVSRLNGCRYCVAAYSALAAGDGLDTSVVEAVREDKPIDDPELEAVRGFTAQLVEGRGWVADDDVQAFLDKGFTKRHVLDILTGVAHKTLSNYTNHLAHTPLDAVFASYAWDADR
jgi:uncharacterized peroxidase-related enzyme